MSLQSASVMNRTIETTARPKSECLHSMGMNKRRWDSILTYIKGHNLEWHSKGLHSFQARRNIYSAWRCRRAQDRAILLYQLGIRVPHKLPLLSLQVTRRVSQIGLRTQYTARHSTDTRCLPSNLYGAPIPC